MRAITRVISCLVLFCLMIPLIFAGQAPVQAPWVDMTKVQGRLLASVDSYVGYGITAFGTVDDPQLVGLDATWTAPSTAACSFDPNTRGWEVTWWPVIGEVGTHYVILKVTEKAAEQPQIEVDVATLAVRVRLWKPPVINYGGCRTLRR